MKQVIFAIALLAMASLTGCLNTDDTSVDDDNEMLDPVGQVEIPENSSIFMDSVGQSGKWNCTGNEADRVCNYEYYANDHFENEYDDNGYLRYIRYRDSDGIQNSIDFNGWVNKTGNSVTIEGLYFPDRGPVVSSYSDEQIYYRYDYTNTPVSGNCNSGNECQIIFYGHNGLNYNGWFSLSDRSSWDYSVDTDGDGQWDEYHDDKHEYIHHSVIFDLPFEPYAFSILSGYNLEQLDRIF